MENKDIQNNLPNFQNSKYLEIFFSKYINPKLKNYKFFNKNPTNNINNDNNNEDLDENSTAKENISSLIINIILSMAIVIFLFFIELPNLKYLTISFTICFLIINIFLIILKKKICKKKLIEKIPFNIKILIENIFEVFIIILNKIILVFFAILSDLEISLIKFSGNNIFLNLIFLSSLYFTYSRKTSKNTLPYYTLIFIEFLLLIISLILIFFIDFFSNWKNFNSIMNLITFFICSFFLYKVKNEMEVNINLLSDYVENLRKIINFLALIFEKNSINISYSLELKDFGMRKSFEKNFNLDNYNNNNNEKYFNFYEQKMKILKKENFIENINIHFNNINNNLSNIDFNNFYFLVPNDFNKKFLIELNFKKLNNNKNINNIPNNNNINGNNFISNNMFNNNNNLFNSNFSKEKNFGANNNLFNSQFTGKEAEEFLRFQMQENNKKNLSNNDLIYSIMKESSLFYPESETAINENIRNRLFKDELTDLKKMDDSKIKKNPIRKKNSDNVKRRKSHLNLDYIHGNNANKFLGKSKINLLNFYHFIYFIIFALFSFLKFQLNLKFR